jgi:N-acyl-D-aspartate/D-glutamate deacylase
VIASCAKNHDCEGKSLAALAVERGTDPADTLFDLMLEEQGDVLMLSFRMCEEDVATILRHPLSMVGSDAIPSPGKPHPRFFGTFPRVLRKYVREDKVLTLPEAVRKMSSLPAGKLGLKDRGLIRTGLAADIVVFDAAAVADHSQYSDPWQYATGIDTVLVNGQVTLRQGQYTGVLAGKVLRK